MTKDRRLGRFKLPLQAIDDEPAVVRIIMGQCIVLQAQYSFTSQQFEYVALCDDFLEVADASIPPEYDIEFDGETVTWVLPEAG